MSTQLQFEKFYENIKLTSTQREDAKTKYDGVCGKLHSHYYPESQYNGDTRFLIGSYGKKTHIRPARDIDVIFILPPEKFAQYTDNRSNCQAQLLQDIRAVLLEKYPDTPIKAWGKVVALEFSEPQHKVELLPAWENEDGTFTIPNSENGGRWEIVRYREEIARIKKSDEETAETKKLIRMCKKWSDQCTARVKSYTIEQNVLDFLSHFSSEENQSSVVYEFFSYFHSRTIDPNLKSHLATALNRASKAVKFEEDGQIEDATEEWRKVFGNDFPAFEQVSFAPTPLEKAKALEALYPAQNEEFLDTTYDIPFELDQRYKLKIDAQITQRGYRPGWLSNFVQRRIPLFKKKKLKFAITVNSVHFPYDVMWKVRNFGDEAQRAEDLRGEISRDKGFQYKEENTKYSGEHYVECYVVKEGRCVAVDRIFVPIGTQYE